jgi:hypothetical protein
MMLALEPVEKRDYHKVPIRVVKLDKSLQIDKETLRTPQGEYVAETEVCPAMVQRKQTLFSTAPKVHISIIASKVPIISTLIALLGLQSWRNLP